MNVGGGPSRFIVLEQRYANVVGIHVSIALDFRNDSDGRSREVWRSLRVCVCVACGDGGERRSSSRLQGLEGIALVAKPSEFALTDLAYEIGLQQEPTDGTGKDSAARKCTSACAPARMVLSPPWFNC